MMKRNPKYEIKKILNNKPLSLAVKEVILFKKTKSKIKKMIS